MVAPHLLRTMRSVMSTRSVQRLLILGWDAADWQIIDPLIARGQMPHLAALIAAGTRANLRTLEPKLSPILWSTIATGKTAEKHGILNFVEPNPSGDGVRVSSSTTRKTKALWNILTQSGMRVHSVGWYASHPAESISGTCVSNLLMEQAPSTAGAPWPLMAGVVHGSPETATRIAAARVRVSDITRDELKELLPNAAQATRGDHRPATLAKEFARMRSLHRAALETLRSDTWDCALVFHDTIDTMGHHFMEYRPPRMNHVKAADLRVYGEVMDRVYRMHDRLLGELLEAAGVGTSVILVSDHGFHSGTDRPVILDVTKEERAALESRWHRVHGVAIFSGPGFRSGESIGAPTLLDITPTALAALGLPVGLDMDGRVVTEAFAVAPPVVTIPSWDDVSGDAGMHPPEMRQDPFEASDALQQLIDLGYMADMGGDQRKLVELTRRESQFNLGVVLMTTGRAALAVPIFSKLVAEYPDEIRYLSLLVQCQHGAGDYAAALASLEQWEQHAPGHAEPAMFRVACLIALGHDAAANDALEMLVRNHGSSPDRARPIADLFAFLGQWRTSSEHAARAIAHDPAATEPLLSAARAALELGNFEECAELCMDATERVMATPEAHHLLGAALAWAGELEHAAQSFGIALKFAPRNYESLAFASAVERARGNMSAVAELDARLLESADVHERIPGTSMFARRSTRSADAWKKEHCP